MSHRKGHHAIPFNFDPPITEWQWRRGSGSASQIWMEGSFLDLYNKTGALQQNFDSIDIRQKSGTWYRLEAAQASDQVTVIHEVSGTPLLQSKLINPVIKSLLAPRQITGVLAAVENFKKTKMKDKDYSLMLGEVIVAVGPNPSQAQLIAGGDLAVDLVHDNQDFINFEYAYRHTLIIAARTYDANPGLFGNAYANTCRIFSEALLREREGIPSSFGLPPAAVDNVSPAQWLKQASHSHLTYGQKRTLVTEYRWADTWSTTYYRTAV